MTWKELQELHFWRALAVGALTEALAVQRASAPAHQMHQREMSLRALFVDF